MGWKYRSLTWRYNIGIVLMGIPALSLIVFLLVGYFYFAFLFITDQPIPRATPGYGNRVIFRSRIETKIIDDQYLLKEWNSDTFREVEKSYFQIAIDRENAQIRKSYVFSIGMLSFVVGFLLLKSLENKNFGLRDASCPQEMRSLKALAKKRGISFDG